MQTRAVALACGAIASLGLPAAAQSTSLVSAKSSGAQVPEDSESGLWGPALSDDGRWAGFESFSDALVAGDGNQALDVFLRDMHSGALRLVSETPSGTSGNNSSSGQSLSADGTLAAFVTLALDLTPASANDANGFFDVLVRDLVSGAYTPVTRLPNGVWSDKGGFDAEISADGKWVAFSSRSTNLVATPPGTNELQVYVRELSSGAFERVSVDGAGNSGLGENAYCSISGDGLIVAFASKAANLVPGDTNGARDVFVRDRVAGVTSRVSVATGGGQAHGESAVPHVSRDGRYVAFSSTAPDLVAGDMNGKGDVFVHDLQTGVTTRALMALGGLEPDDHSGAGYLSADGRYLSVNSRAANLYAGDQPGTDEVFRLDRSTGELHRCTTDTLGVAGMNINFGGPAAVSADGRFVLFESTLTQLVPVDANGARDVFLRDLGSAAASPYCTSKVNSQGCIPWMSISGAPSARLAQPFLLGAAQVLNLTVGVLIYSTGAQALPFQQGTLCVGPQVTRTPGQASGGSSGAPDCSGSFQLDMNAYIQSGVDATLVPGQGVFAQYWSRDPSGPATTSLSNAVVFLIGS
jgi:Tol biopolymer transport system component